MRSMMEKLENYLEEASVKHKENENNKILKRGRENEKDGMEMERRKNRGGQGICVSKLYTLEKWRTRGTRES